TTPVDPAVVEAMLPYWTATWGNPSSLYTAGRAARAALDEARAAVAGVLRCAPGEVVFTSGGSEGDNLALKGVVQAARPAGRAASPSIPTRCRPRGACRSTWTRSGWTC